MKRLLVSALVVLSSPGLAGAQATTAPPPVTVRYGANPAAGHTFTHDAVRLYCEVYGTGEPLLVVHGNGGRTGMMLQEPNIEVKALEDITAPTLVLAADHDVIQDEHTVDIFHHIPNSQLAIFPNATHMIPFDDPATFNAIVERFLRTPFVKKDRIKDLLASLEKLRAASAPGQK